MTPDFKDLAQIYQQRALESLSEEDLAHAKRYRVAAELEATCVDHGEIQKALCERIAELEATLRECYYALDAYWDRELRAQIKAIVKTDEVLK